jgi:WD repeat-containing protein 35
MNSEATTELESNQLTNFLAFGDVTGLLQVVDISQNESKNESLPISKENSIIQQKKTSFQGLIFHKHPINRIQWNPKFEKIVTVDDGNSLVVWNKGENDLYSSQMVNNRGLSTIVDVRWSKSGRDISFLYEDGHIYSGTVEGKNTWFNNLEEETSFIEYSPNDDKILVSKKREKIFVLSSSGRQVGEITLTESIKNMEIVNINWWGGNSNYYENDIFQKKHLMIAFKNGTVILIDDETDDDPVVIKTELKKITKTQWEVDGLCIAILGELYEDDIIKEEDEKEDEKENEKDEDNKNNEIDTNKKKKNNANNGNPNPNHNNRSIVLFYNIKGELIKKFICPCHVNTFSWGLSSTLALAAEKYIYLAFVKYKYKWTYFNNTIVFGYLLSDNKYNIIFLDTINNNKQCKLVYNLIDILSSDFLCTIIQEKEENQYSFMITNNFCNVLDTKFCPVKPIYTSMNNEFIAISNYDYIYVLQYQGYIKPKAEGTTSDRNKMAQSDLGLTIRSRFNISMNKLDSKTMNEFCFFIDDDLSPGINYDYNNFRPTKTAKNQISSIYLSSSYNLYVAKTNGIINKYNLYLMTIDKKFKIDENIKYIGLSPFEKYLWSINTNDYLSVYSMEKENPEKLNYYQKEIWDIKWCIKKDDEVNNDDTLEFAILQKNRLYFINNLQVEGEMQKCPDYLGIYIDNEVTAVRIEKLNNDRNNDFFEGKDYLKKYENKVLREFNELMEDDEKTDLKEAFDYATKHPCTAFFSTITKKALDKNDLDTAQNAMLQTGDFEGLEFLKSIKNIEDEELKKAEILQYNSNYDEASRRYNRMNRGDLNLAMQVKLGNWDKVTDIMSKNNPNSKDENLKIAYNNYADELMEKKDYNKAEENYEKAGNIQGLANVYFAKEDYMKAADILEVIPEEDEFLEEMGDKFRGVGMCDEAVKAYIKRGNISKAMETYVANNKWGEAIELSRQNDFINMETLTNKFSSEFIKSGRKLDLIELYNKANMKTEVNKYLIEIACDMRRMRLGPLFIKKIYVLAALELERYKSLISDSQVNNDDHIHNNNQNEESKTMKKMKKKN